MKGIKMMSQGWQSGKKIVLFLLVQAGISVSAQAGSLTVRDIHLVSNNKIEIILDGVTQKGNLDIDYVRDIVQFSIQNSTIYPAKIVHADVANHESSFSKVFAYQYAPNLVRVRFNVEGQAQDYKGKVKWFQKGKSIVVQFPEVSVSSKVKQDANSDSQLEEKKERSLLAKVLGQDKPVENKIEVIKEEQGVKAAPEKKGVHHPAKLSAHDTEVDAGIPKNNEKVNLGGQKNGPSVLRSFLAMFAIVGGLGLFLLYIKKKKNGPQAKKIGESWFSDFLPDSMKKQKSWIEVLGTHSLGPKQSIVVVRIRGQQLVLGVTQDNVQLITQIDSDDHEGDLLEDPVVAASIGKMFGAKPVLTPTMVSVQKSSPKTIASNNDSFNSILKMTAKEAPVSSSQALAARNAYTNQSYFGESGIPVVQVNQGLNQNSVRDQIKKRLEAMK